MGDLALTEARRAWPGKTLCVNFPGGKLYRADEEIVSYAAELLREGMAGGRFLLTFSEDFPQPEPSLRLVAEGVARYQKEDGNKALLFELV